MYRGRGAVKRTGPIIYCMVSLTMSCYWNEILSRVP